MAQNKETRIWQELKNLDKDWHFTRIESSTVNGIPDVHCVVNKQVFWLELKANTSKNCGLSKYQINWHIKYLKAGGRAYILNRPLLQAPYELLAVNRESRTPLPLSRHTDLRTLISLAAELAAGPVKQGSWFPRPRSHSRISQRFWTINSGRRSWCRGSGSCCFHAPPRSTLILLDIWTLIYSGQLGSGAAGQEMVWFCRVWVWFIFIFLSRPTPPFPFRS